MAAAMICMVGLQLDPFGPLLPPARHDRLEPQILYHHPLLDAKFKLPDDYPLMSDDAYCRP